MPPGLRTTAPLLIALLGLTACSGVADPIEPDPLAGAWAGVTASPNVRLVLSLREVPSGLASTLEGEGELSGAGPTIAVSIRGERAGAGVRLVLSSADYMPIEFTGNVLKAGTRLEGTLLGSGIMNLPFVLDRGDQAP
jgi:hypothetical protein